MLVVGSGPAGSAVALRLAQQGHRVTVVEKRPVPRHKACGDVLTPRSLAELHLLGVDALAVGGRRIEGVRMIAAGRELIEPWPSHPDLPGHGAVLRGDLLDELLRERVRSAGASILMGHEALAPVVDRGFVRGATRHDRGWRTRDPVTVRGGRRRRQQPIRPCAGHDRDARLAVRNRDTELLAQPAQQRHVVGDPARHPRREWQPDRRVRLGRPGRRRHGEHRYRSAVVVSRCPRCELAQVARRVREAGGRCVADRSGRAAEVADPVPCPARRFGRPDDGPDVPRRRRRRRCGKPLQRRRRERGAVDRAPRGRRVERCAHDRQFDLAAAVSDAARRRRRPVRQGGSARRPLPRARPRSSARMLRVGMRSDG